MIGYIAIYTRKAMHLMLVDAYEKYMNLAAFNQKKILGGSLMCYLVVNNFGERGSIAVQMQHGPRLRSLTHYIEEVRKGKGSQIITLSNPDAYKEYAPYDICSDEAEFVQKVLSM